MKTSPYTMLFTAMISAAVVMVAPYLIPLPAIEDTYPASLAGPGGRFIDVGGVRTYVEEAGPANGPPVLLIHGMGSSTFSWRHTLPALAKAGYRAVACDLRGFGLSDKVGAADYSHQAQAEAMAHLMNILGISKAVVVGHSMGANVAAHLAVSHPERVEKLVIVDGYFIQKKHMVSRITGTMLRFPPFRRWGRLALRTLLTPDNVTRVIRSAFADPAAVTAQVVSGYMRPLQTAGWDEAALGIVRDLGRSVLTAPLSSIRIEALFIWGEGDRWVPLAKGKAFQRQMVGAELVKIPHAGHMPMEERPHAFNEVLVTFLRKDGY